MTLTNRDPLVLMQPMGALVFYNNLLQQSGEEECILPSFMWTFIGYQKHLSV